MISIDVNSGRSIKQKNVESTALDTNLEAAEEIARQIKIRDLSGLIIIDFIDMMNFGNRRIIERKLKEKCRNDRARIQIGRISNFGLLEMSRQRLRESSVKWQISLTNETHALKIIKIMEVRAIENKAKIVELKVCEQIFNFINENLSENLKFIEKKNKIKINIDIDNAMLISDHKIELRNKSKKVINVIEKSTKLEKIKTEIIDDKISTIKKNKSFKKSKFKKKIFYKKKFLKKKTK